MTTPLNLDKNIITINPGDHSTPLLKQLLNPKKKISLYAIRFTLILTAQDRSIKPGEYQIETNDTIASLLKKIKNRQAIYRNITIPEGLTVYQVLDILSQNPHIYKKNIPPTSIKEGSLLPNTYNFVHGDTLQSIIEHMQAKQHEILESMWPNKTNKMIKSKQDLVTLASIIEKETGVEAERPIIASVFTNRLRLRMPLQSDPTVIYAITEGTGILDRKLFSKDLKAQSPFNTYTNRGLPPAPIANPGINSIDAALKPQKTSYIYFVADGKGGHNFAKSLKQHINNKIKLQQLNKPPTEQSAAP